MTRWLAITVLLTALVLAAPLPAVCAGEKGDANQKLKSLEEKERKLLRDLELSERRIADIENRIAPIEEEIRRTRERMIRGEKELTSLKKRVVVQKDYLARRVKAIYRLKDGGVLPILLRADSVQDMIKRYRYMALILKRDEKVLREYANRAEVLENTRARLKADQKRLYDLRVEMASKAEELQRSSRKMTSLLMEVHQRKEVYLAYIRSKEANREKVIRQATEQPEKKPAQAKRNSKPAPAGKEYPGFQSVPKEDQEKTAETQKPKPAQKTDAPKKKTGKYSNFAALKGKIPLPVNGRITGKFGLRKGAFGISIQRHGVIFSAGEGAAVYAVQPGNVIYSGWMKGYGNIVIVNHGNRYYSLTGGLSGIRQKVGHWVEKGELLGRSPKGSQNGKKEIYFEIRHGSQALNPEGWLGKKPAA